MAGGKALSLLTTYKVLGTAVTNSSFSPTASEIIDKLKSLFKSKKKETTAATNGTAGTKTETPTAAAVPTPTKTDTAAAPSTSDPTAPPAGKLA